jgi:K+-transporting ATPase KdpF subunit
LPEKRERRKRVEMLENVLGGIASAAVLVYLLWALLEPERF